MGCDNTNKFHAKKINIQGETFDSMAEAKRWRDLTWLERGGVIRGLQRQVPYVLLPAQYDDSHKMIERSITYVADFVYYDEHGSLVVEDVKGYKKGPAYALFVIKRKLLLYFYGIRIKEVS